MAGNIAQRAAKAIASAFAWQTFWTYAFTPLVGVVTFALGVVEKLPLMWALMAGTVSFAMTGLGLLSFYQWRFRRSPENKISFIRPAVVRPDGDENKVLLGIVLKNLADFPVEATLARMDQRCSARIPSQPRLVPHTILVDVANDFYFTGLNIDVTGVTDDPMKAELDVVIEYGRPGGRRFSASYSHTMLIPRDVNKGYTWQVNSVPGEQPAKLTSAN